MADKEKLVELLKLNYPCDYEDCEDCQRCDDEAACLQRLKEVLADHLIENGVTIPVRSKDTGECRMFCCSRCGYGVNDIFVENEGDHLPDKGPIFNYCPWCGAKIDLEG